MGRYQLNNRRKVYLLKKWTSLYMFRSFERNLKIKQTLTQKTNGKQTKLGTSKIRLHSTHLIWFSSLILFYLKQELCVGVAHSSNIFRLLTRALLLLLLLPPTKSHLYWKVCCVFWYNAEVFTDFWILLLRART